MCTFSVMVSAHTQLKQGTTYVEMTQHIRACLLSTDTFPCLLCQADIASVQPHVAGLQPDFASLQPDVAGLQSNLPGLQPHLAGVQPHVAGLFVSTPSLPAFSGGPAPPERPAGTD